MRPKCPVILTLLSVVNGLHQCQYQWCISMSLRSGRKNKLSRIKQIKQFFLHLRDCRLHLNQERKPNPNPYNTLLTLKLLEPGVVSLPNSVCRLQLGAFLILNV